MQESQRHTSGMRLARGTFRSEQQLDDPVGPVQACPIVTLLFFVHGYSPKYTMCIINFELGNEVPNPRNRAGNSVSIGKSDRTCSGNFPFLGTSNHGGCCRNARARSSTCSWMPETKNHRFFSSRFLPVVWSSAHQNGLTRAQRRNARAAAASTSAKRACS